MKVLQHKKIGFVKQCFANWKIKRWEYRDIHTLMVSLSKKPATEKQLAFQTTYIKSPERNR